MIYLFTIDILVKHDNVLQKVPIPFKSCCCPCSLHNLNYLLFATFAPSPVSWTDPAPIPVPSPVPAPTLVHQRPILNIWYLPIVHSSISAIQPVTPAPLSLDPWGGLTNVTLFPITAQQIS